MQNARAPVPSVSDIFSLSTEQQATFLAFFNHPEQQAVEPHERVYQFLSRLVSGFDYQGQNYTATEAFELKKGNCITLAVLTKALADLAGVDISFQQMASAPVYSIEQDWFISSDHVRTFLFANPSVVVERKLWAMRSYIVVDYFPAAGDRVGERLPMATFIAMYYRNLAADAIFAGQYTQALALLREALQYAPEYSAIINLTALVHRYIEQQPLAEQWYQYGLAVSSQKATLLGNYAVLKYSMGEDNAAADLHNDLLRLQEKDPYIWFIQGKTALAQQNTAVAISHFKRLIEYAPYIAQFHLELAKAYYLEQRYADARSTLADAAAVASTTADKKRFNAKLEALKLHASL